MSLKHDHNSSRDRGDANQYVEKLLSSLDEIKSAHPQPYLHARVKARLSQSHDYEQEPTFLAWFWNGKWSLAVMAAILVLNASVLLYYFDSQGLTFGKNATAEKIIEEYQLDYQSTYTYLDE